MHFVATDTAGEEGGERRRVTRHYSRSPLVNHHSEDRRRATLLVRGIEDK